MTARASAEATATMVTAEVSNFPLNAALAIHAAPDLG